MTDIAYEKYVAREEGLAEGRETATRKHVENALRDNVLTVEQIAKYNEVSEEYVLKVKAEL